MDPEDLQLEKMQWPEWCERTSCSTRKDAMGGVARTVNDWVVMIMMRRRSTCKKGIIAALCRSKNVP